MKEEIKKLTKNPNLIPGIYNYCDRWCERCEFTSCCATFSIDEMLFPNLEELDINNKVFWEKLGNVLNTTLEMVIEFAKEQGIDLESIDLEASIKAEEELEKEAANFECSHMSKAYSGLVKSWFDSSSSIFNEKLKELRMIDELGLPNSKKQVDDLNDSIEVILWYQNQINAKIMRAAMGKLEDESEIEDEFPKDSDGSAKVALIGIDRSIAAWGQMLAIFPNQEDELLEILVLLERLRRKTEKEFPNARAFIRAGFDEKK